jgi:predicted transcriptional regulator
MKKFTTRFSDQELALLESLAKREGRSRSAIVRDALTSYIVANPIPLPDWIGTIDKDDGTLTARNVKEWLRANWRPE